jgi:hypothetical protein
LLRWGDELELMDRLTLELEFGSLRELELASSRE